MVINKSPINIDFSQLKKGQTIILAISGGPDSVFLLNQLVQLKIKPTIILCHINYQLRGWASKSDQEFVEKLGKQHSLKTEIFTSKVKKLAGNLEENCRKIRYWYFEEMRQKHQADWILTGHQLNDQIETFLLNLCRGSTLNGFSAMSSIDSNRHLLRPLLKISKAEILDYLKANKLSFRQDRSNYNLSFTRNFLRHKIIPLFQKINPNFLHTLSEGILNQQENQLIIQDQINLWLKENLKTISTKKPNSSNKKINQPTAIKYSFQLQKFLDCSPALQKKLLAGTFKFIHQKALTGHQLKEILQTIQKNRSGLNKEFGPQTKLSIIKDTKTQKRLVVIESKLD